MKPKSNKENYAKKADKKPIKNKKKIEWNWVIKITIISFVVSFTFSFLSENIIPNVNIFASIIILLIVIFIGIIFDIIGISVTVADPSTFHSMSSKKVKGATIAVKLINNAEKVSSFCNDVIGDICGIISGATGATIAILLANKLNINVMITSLTTTALIASLTIGGKAIGKSFAINKSNTILYKFSQILSFYKRQK